MAYFTHKKPHKRGSELSPAEQAYVLAAYVHRFTADHTPQWARETLPSDQPYMVQFSSDRDWLENTLFQVTKSGKLDRRTRDCCSMPTWPQGKGA